VRERILEKAGFGNLTQMVEANGMLQIAGNTVLTSRKG
jgi:hypothetical protein